MYFDLQNQNLDIEGAANKVLDGHTGILEDLLTGLLSREDVLRFNCYKVLLLVSEKDPKRLYPKWDYFMDLLNSDNTSRKYIGIHLIANLTKADIEGKFEKGFKQFFGLLRDRSVIPVSHVAGVSGSIAKIKPHLQSKITKELLMIDEINPELKQKELVKSYVITSFNEYFPQAKNQKKILDFVRAQQFSKSPKTREKALQFLEKWG